MPSGKATGLRASARCSSKSSLIALWMSARDTPERSRPCLTASFNSCLVMPDLFCDDAACESSEDIFGSPFPDIERSEVPASLVIGDVVVPATGRHRRPPDGTPKGALLLFH